MKRIHVTLEAGKDGYGLWFDEIENVFGFGETVEKAKTDAKAALEGYVVALERCNQPVPEILQGEYELVFGFDTKALLKHISGTVTKTALSKASGINVSQLNHYSSGLKKPRKKQRDKIIAALHKIANDLLTVS
jgi:predicted RNase H-like HicB family nuclease